MNPLPFPEEENTFAHSGISSEQLSIMASKKLINTMFRWHEMKVDRDGNVFNFDDDEIGSSLSKSLCCLRIYNAIKPEQVRGIIRHLSDGKYE